MYLTEPQANYIEESFADFAKTLNKDQLKELYFRLDDLIQYSGEALGIAYTTVAKVREGKSLKCSTIG